MNKRQEIIEALTARVTSLGWTKDRWGNLVNQSKTQRIKFKELVFRHERIYEYESFPNGEIKREWMIYKSGYYARCQVLPNGKIKTS